MPRAAQAIGVGVLFFATGYLRDFIFINLNAQLYFLNGQTTEPHTHKFFAFLDGVGFNTIYYGKYLLTGLFIAISLGLTYWVLMILFRDKRFAKVCLPLYGFILALAIISFGLGFVFNASEDGYLVARNLAGIIQGPLPALILIAARPLKRSLSRRD